MFDIIINYMLTVIFGKDKNLVDCELQQQLNFYTNQPKFLGSIEDVYFQINQFNLLENSKYLVVKNVNYFSSINDFNLVKNYLNIISYDKNIFVFLTVYDKISQAKSINDFLDKVNFCVINELKQKNLFEYITNWFIKKDIFIDSQLVKKISEKLIPNSALINLELSKLIGYSNINEKIIDELICDYKEHNVFNLLRYILNNDINSSLNLYLNLSSSGYDEITLLQIISQQLNQLLAIKLMLNKKMSVISINKILELNFYFLEETAKFLSDISLSKLYFFIDKIIELDYKIKCGLADKNNIFKYFLLKL